MVNVSTCMPHSYCSSVPQACLAMNIQQAGAPVNICIPVKHQTCQSNLCQQPYSMAPVTDSMLTSGYQATSHPKTDQLTIQNLPKLQAEPAATKKPPLSLLLATLVMRFCCTCAAPSNNKCVGYSNQYRSIVRVNNPVSNCQMAPLCLYKMMPAPAYCSERS